LCKPAYNERRRDIIGKVRRDAADARLFGEPPVIGFKGIHEKREEAALASVFNLSEDGPEALVALNCNHCSRAFEKEAARQAAGPGPDLENLDAFKRSSCSGNAPRNVKVEKKILPKRLLRREPGLPDRLPQGRQGRNRVRGRHVRIAASRLVSAKLICPARR